MLEPKAGRESDIILHRFTMPEDANPLGNVHGGIIMKMVDEAGGLCAMRHARRPVVTVAMDSMTFLSPIHIGELVTMKASVNYVGRTSLEVGVKVIAENPVTGETTHTNSAYLVYVALDDDSNPTIVPPLAIETDVERQRWEAAKARQQRRLRESNRAPTTPQP